MLKKRVKSLIIFSLVLSFLSSSVFAQSDSNQFVDETKNDLLIVVGGGLAGAVLGLSTLSFVDEPKDHTRNILVGASIGIIAGVALVAFNQANKSRDYLGPGDSYSSKPKFNTKERSLWHSQEFWAKSDTTNDISLSKISYQFSF